MMRTFHQVYQEYMGGRNVYAYLPPSTSSYYRALILRAYGVDIKNRKFQELKK